MSMLLKYRNKAVSIMVVSMLAGAVFGGASSRHVSAASVAGGPQDAKEVEQFADSFFNQPEIKDQMAGAVFVVVKGDQVILKKGYGYANVEEKLPVDPNRTVFRIASVSKVVTATAVMQLVEQGKLDLNKQINAYLGPVQIPNQTNVPLTMKDLLMNATGFDYGDGSGSLSMDLASEVSLKDYVMDNKPVVIRNPGEYYRYDNLGFTIQGYAVEQVSGQAYGAYVKEQIFKPLGMENSDFRLTASILKQLAVAYNPMGEAIPTYTTVPTEFPAGGMLSTGSDMAKFMIAHLGGGKLGNASILKAETVEEMHSPQLAIHAKLPNMAYGFEYANQQIYNGHDVVEKGGDTDGYHTGMWLIPDEQIGVFVSVNKDQEIRTPLFEAFMDHYYPDEAGPKEPLESAKQPLHQFEGNYGDLRNRLWTSQIRAEDGKLIVNDPFGEHVLYEIEPLLFQDEQGIKAAFKLNDKGEVQSYYYDMKSDSWAEKLVDPPRYEDVSESDHYADYIDHLRQLKVIGESAEQLFHPDQSISREEFIGWFIRWLGVAPSKQKTVFTDTLNSPYVKEIQAAYELGVIKGTTNGKFYPQNPLTRQEAAAIIWRMANALLHAEPREAQLIGQTDSWALEGVRYVVSKTLYGTDATVNENGAIDYRSKQPMLRKEAAALLSRFTDNLF